MSHKSTKPIASLKIFIHSPGLGSALRALGKRLIIIKGKAKPKPIKRKNSTSIGEDRRNATSNAGPIKGPIQEKPIKKAKTPLKKEPIYPPLEVAFAATFIPGKVISQTFNKDKPKRKRILIIIRL